MSTKHLRVVSYNMYGKTSLLPVFRTLLRGEQIICLQEVDDPKQVKQMFPDYPYTFSTKNTTTKSNWPFPAKETHVLICSQLPFASVHSQLIQIDPGGDQWKRHAQHVQVKLDGSTTVDLFHYHNTYNWRHHSGKSEEEGLIKFIDYVEQRTGRSLHNAQNLILTGDFNYTEKEGGSDILHPLNISAKWVDYVCASMGILSKGSYSTISLGLSDHDAVWAQLDVLTDVSAATGKDVQIFNIHQGEYLYAASYQPFDRDRRRVFTWRPGQPVSQGVWRLEPHGHDTFRIFNTKHGEYLYAASYSPFDRDRRRVFTWQPGTPVSQGTWKLIDMGQKGFRIYNVEQQEYLYAGDYKPFDKQRRRVFTWRSGAPVSQGYWKVG